VAGHEGARAPAQRLPRRPHGAVKEGQTKAKVGTICACSSTKTGQLAGRNGNTYWEWMYLTPTGEAFVYYRYGSDGAWHVGFRKYWCPGDTMGVETLDQCSYVDFG
jgi:hypothetical protein